MFGIGDWGFRALVSLHSSMVVMVIASSIVAGVICVITMIMMLGNVIRVFLVCFCASHTVT